MCGRFELHSTLEIITQIFGVLPRDIGFTIKPSYNIAPTHDIPVVVMNGKRRLVQSRWGLIPSWAKEEKTGYSMINARAETAAEKPAFRSSFKKHRCLVIADGFYEWQKTEKEKQPFYIHLKTGKPMGFAGLYSIWSSPEGEEINTCTIIVTSANELLSPIHDRMPVILDTNDLDDWLNPAIEEPAKLLPLLKPFDGKKLELYKVSTKVNSPKNNSADLIKRIK
jgi:putative SOS response-associated peptidase YedK